MEHILFNLRTSGRVRRATRNGRTYLVAPATILVPGVLAGSEGPLYYPKSEIAANPGVWNDTPIVVYHPTENGRHVAARSPNVLDKYKIGRVYNDHTTNKGTRRVEAWFDEERTKAVDKRIHKSLLKGAPIELSTGLYTKNEYRDGTYKGKGYTAIARNYLPDHLAILPDQIGACSIKDGCGVFNAFCATGSGGGVDPSCSGGEGSGSGTGGDTSAKKASSQALRVAKQIEIPGIKTTSVEASKSADQATKAYLKNRTQENKNAAATAHKKAADKHSEEALRWKHSEALDAAKLHDLHKQASSKHVRAWKAHEEYVKLNRDTRLDSNWKPLGNEGYGEQTAPSKRCTCQPGEKGACKACADTPIVGNSRSDTWEPLTTITANYDKSYEDKRSDLSSQLVERFKEDEPSGPQEASYSYHGRSPYVVDLYDGYVVYSFKGQLYRLDYSEEDSACTLSEDDPTEVRRVTSYEPVTNAKDDGTPSESLDITPEKACQIIKDGSANGKPLTESQRGMFGAKCGERKKESTKNVFTPLTTAWLPIA